MGRKSRSGFSFSWSWIIFTIIVYNVFFSSDDNDNTEIKVVDQDKPAIVKTIKDTGKEIGNTLVEALKEQEVDKKVSELLNGKQETESEPVPEPEEKKKEPVMVAEPEKEITPDLKPVDNQPPEEGMKKL
jgi:hypothetical protein